MEMETGATFTTVKTSVIALILIRSTCFYINSDKKTSEIMGKGTFISAKRIRFQRHSDYEK